VQWGDGTHSRFFLPSAPSPAEVDPAAGKKNAYINLHRGGTLAFNYNGPVTLNVGITGGGGGPNRTGSTGLGNVAIVSTAGNDVTFAQPQNYNGATTIGANAILRLGTGVPVPLNFITVNATNNTKTTVRQATYSGDASLLTAESANGVSTNAIVNNGQLIVQNTSTAITLSQISGAGSFRHDGAATTTLLNNTYSGGTTINAGTVLAGSANAFGTGRLTNSAGLALTAAQHELALGGFTQGAGGVLTLVRLSTVVPNAPGNLGLINLACVMALGIFEVEKTDAKTFSIILFVTLTIPLLIGGALATALTGVNIGELRDRAKRGATRSIG
jgi:autotransporter-associated beta strand protein